MVSSRIIPETALPRARQRTGLQGTSVESRLFSMTANRPLSRSTSAINVFDVVARLGLGIRQPQIVVVACHF